MLAETDSFQLSQKEKELVLAYAATLPRSREVPVDLLGDYVSMSGVKIFFLSIFCSIASTAHQSQVSFSI